MANENDIPSKTEKFVLANVDSEHVIMQIDNGYFFTLNPTAEAIWNRIDGENSTAAIINSIAEEYGITASDCEDDIQDFLSDLKENDLVTFG